MASFAEVQQAMQQFRAAMIDSNPMNIDVMDFRNAPSPQLIDMGKEAAKSMAVAKATGRI